MQIADSYLHTEDLDLEWYLTNISYLIKYLKENLTTKALAKYIIDLSSQ